jgi:oligopeptide/dipeptide ABC transporter ATP-binding protein
LALLVENLKVRKGEVEIVCDGHLKVEPGERVAVVGESGSGKSITAFTLLKLLPEGLKAEGRVEVDGTDVLSLKGEELRRFRWKKVSMVFQDPSAALNPLMKVGEQIGEALLYHGFKGTKEELRQKVVELLKECEVPKAEERYDAYPHHLSGGLKQRVAIAMAVACNPSYLIADEPTTALDVSVQAKILTLFKKLSAEQGTGIVLITHDVGVVAQFAQKVFVTYAGYTVEAGGVKELLNFPLHPYTEGLIECTPELSCEVKGKRRLKTIPGSVPEPQNRPRGCPFHPRCRKAKQVCKEETPPLKKVGERSVACFFPNY